MEKGTEGVASHKVLSADTELSKRESVCCPEEPRAEKSSEPIR